MQHFTATTTGRPISIDQSTESQVYALFGLAMGITVAGVYIGSLYAPTLLHSGFHWFFLIAELALILTARLWVNKSPLNYLLFALFPLLSGFSITPLILSVITEYANGTAILLNALSATGFMAASAAVFARTTSWNLGVMGRGLFFALIGLILLGLMQMFIPGLRTTQFELMLSGAGVVIFGLFTAYDFQRVAQMSRQGANPIMLALSLYLDIFNLFLYILRFMLALSGNRR
ncbi:MAG: Bax inhibitor-1 family protein [bacterium]|nr:Bax inhibitor-1 family protein [bacterium]